MAVSMAIVPLLKGNVAKSIVKDFKESKLKAFSEEERKKTNSVISELLLQREKRKCELYFLKL